MVESENICLMTYAVMNVGLEAHILIIEICYVVQINKKRYNKMYGQMYGVQYMRILPTS